MTGHDGPAVDWEGQVPGVTPWDDGFRATLHDPRVPFTVRWNCLHVHPSVQAAEDCAAACRAANMAAVLLAPPPGSQVRHYSLGEADLPRLLVAGDSYVIIAKGSSGSLRIAIVEGAAGE